MPRLMSFHSGINRSIAGGIRLKSFWVGRRDTNQIAAEVMWLPGPHSEASASNGCPEIPMSQ